MSHSKLTWGVKASFRAYVEGMGGSITLDDGAVRAEDGTIMFPVAPGGDLAFAPDGSARGSLQLQGTVRFTAHGGMLDSTLAELCLEVTQEGFVLTSLDAPLNQQRCAIATLGPVEVGPDDTITIAAAITDDGMYQIADNYPPGTALDALILT